MILVDCVARENTSYNYSADEGEIIAYNCKSTQSSGNHKEEVNGGAVTVINDNTLTWTPYTQITYWLLKYIRHDLPRYK